MKWDKVMVSYIWVVYDFRSSNQYKKYIRLLLCWYNSPEWSVTVFYHHIPPSCKLSQTLKDLYKSRLNVTGQLEKNKLDYEVEIIITIIINLIIIIIIIIILFLNK